MRRHYYLKSGAGFREATLRFLFTKMVTKPKHTLQELERELQELRDRWDAGDHSITLKTQGKLMRWAVELKRKKLGLLPLEEEEKKKSGDDEEYEMGRKIFGYD